MNKFPISAAVLAGGKNSRLATEKSLIPFGKSTLIDHTLNILDSLFTETLIISDKKILIERFPQRKIYADMLQSNGPLAGIHSALFWAQNKAVFVFACDMPMLNSELIIRMNEHYIDHHKDGLLIAKHKEGKEPLHSIYCKKCLGVIEEQLSANQFKISNIFNKCKTHFYPVPEPLIKVFHNINTKEDLFNWKESC